jgi:hypothetical protein
LDEKKKKQLVKPLFSLFLLTKKNICDWFFTCDVGELLELGRVDLLEFSPDEEAGDPDELKPVLGDVAGDAQVPVQEVHRQVEGLPVQPVHLAHLYQPV